MVVPFRAAAARGSAMLIAGLLFAGAATMSEWRQSRSETANPVPDSQTSAPPVASEAVARNSGYLTSPNVMFFASPSISRHWNVAGDRKSVLLTTFEVFPNEEVGEISQEVSTSFLIQEIAPRGGDELFVVGNPSRGGFLIERWKLPNVRGSTTGRLAPSGTSGGAPVSTPAMGVPTQPWGGQVYIPGGVPQVPLSQRGGLPPIQQYAFAEDVNVLQQGVGADPEGRFVLVVTDTAELRQYFPSTSLTDYAVIENAFSAPDVEHVEGLFYRVQHAVFGRVWFLNWFTPQYADGIYIPAALHKTIVLVDAQNDGFFEEVTSHIVGGPSIVPYLDRSQWLDDFQGSAN